MAIGFSPKLPLRHDATDGFYALNKTLGEVAKQNLKMLVLTAPGERLMDPAFGVGARNYLFEQTREAHNGLSSKILEQVRKYMPFIEIADINLTDLNTNEHKSTHYMGISITYFIANLNLNNTLKITVSSDF